MGCRHSKVSPSTIPATEEPTHDAITTCHTDIMVAKTTETADAISQKDLSPEQVAIDVEKALVNYLHEYTFYHTKNGDQIGEIAMVASPPLYKYVMEVAKKVIRDPAISLAPDPGGTKLSYGLLPTNYTLYAGFKSPNLVIFVYQWTKDTQTYITSPYSLTSTKSGDTVPCATVNITNALLAPHPVSGIELDLKGLNSVTGSPTGSNHNLKGPDFMWLYEGPFVDMSIRRNSTCKLYWQDVSGTNGEVKLIDIEGRKLMVNLANM